MKIKAKVNTYSVLSLALGSAIISGMNKRDKYSESPLTETDRDLLLTHIDSYFWLALDDAGVTLN
jgi:hypothetical protein